MAQGDTTIAGIVIVSGDMYLILEDGCNLTVSKGIQLASGSHLYIYAQSTEKETVGFLTVTDTGITELSGVPTLTIVGGKISASGRSGISAGYLTIMDGYVSASGISNSIAVIIATISGGFVDLHGAFTGKLSTGENGHAVISSTVEINNMAGDCKGFFLIQNEGENLRRYIYSDTGPQHCE